MKRYVVTVLLLVPAVAAHLAIVIAQDRAALDVSSADALRIPSTIGSYRQTGDDAPQDEHVQEILQTSAIIMRNYLSPAGDVIRLAAVRAATTRGSLHFPEVCLVGQGWEIDKQYMAPVGVLFTAKHLVLLSADHKEAVLYWFKTDEHLTGSFFLNSWYWIQQKIQLKAPATTMIRISTSVGDRGEEAAFRTLEDFAAHLAPVSLDEANP